MRRALRSWPQCLVDKGFKRYRTPDDAYQDTAWHRGEDGNTPHARREVSTAVADVECKREHDTVGVWSAVLASGSGPTSRHTGPTTRPRAVTWPP
ncbi:hypothetical protein PH213_08065 [Streptomyces sp. SRF1]|uniref:hypothetical protein n=1 Tax=Streptomyces sp. SRF1 TaxID=1549642 RepID=UPI0025AFB3C2|nr:hypothetical protein [Streptomyces sp. SRF1]MDN3054495.1 hypothetical protein [Streptomyces sp. SRF1]